MLFHSTEFLLFLAAFVLLYSRVQSSLQNRNLLIVGASWLFYGWWNWKLLGLLVLSSVVDYRVGLAIAQSSSDVTRRRWLAVSLVFNLGLLGAFKYLGFFIDSFYALLDTVGVSHPSSSWNILLPVGISFYTFQSLGYTIDVYRRHIAPARDPVAYLAFVAFFPQLVAGPIERARHLLPQFHEPRPIRLADVESGLWLAVWGLFKKVAIADRLAPYAELAFDHDIRSAPVLLLGIVAFAGQIYGDFSGYSDVARGVARCLGFDLMLNFDRPYAAQNIREFWRRWHISLSTWLRDYVYIPLGGNRTSRSRTAFHLTITFLIAGLWHGAAWNFVLWGAWHALALCAHHFVVPSDPGSPPSATFFPRLLRRAVTWFVVGYGWLLFRANSPRSLVQLHESLTVWSAPEWFPDFAIGVVLIAAPLWLAEFWPQTGRFADLTRSTLRLTPDLTESSLARPPVSAQIARSLVFGFLVLIIAAYWERQGVPFLYFQF